MYCMATAPATPKPEAVLLVLDSTNLGRHLMLAAPILALGLPTLIILNMADDLRSRGGKLDLRKLSHELGAPVALINARGGEGIDQVFDFLAGAMAKPLPTLLPVLHDVPKCREWAGGVGTKAGYRPPIAPKWTRRLDAVVPAPGRRPAPLPAGGGRRDPHYLHGGRAHLRRGAEGCSPSAATGLQPRCPRLYSRRCIVDGRVARRGLRGGLPAAGAAAVPVHRHPGRFRIPGARGADRRPHHGTRRLAGQKSSSRCFRHTAAPCRPFWRRAPSRTSATASPPS